MMVWLCLGPELKWYTACSNAQNLSLFHCLSSDCFITTKVQRPAKIPHFFIVSYIWVIFLTLKKTGLIIPFFWWNFLSVSISEFQKERGVLWCCKETGKSPDVGNLSLGFLSAAMVRIRITKLCLLGTSRETRIIECFNSGAPITDNVRNYDMTCKIVKFEIS